MDNDFYISLVSNLHTNEFPNNTGSYFITPLSKPLELDVNKWEVGIVEILYPFTWQNITLNCSKISIIVDKTRPKNVTPMKLSPGFYDVIQLKKELLTKLNNQVWRERGNNPRVCDVDFLEEEQKIRFDVKPGKKIIITESLSKKLGFDGKTEFPEGTHLAKEIIDLNLDNQIMFIYSNVVTETHVGNDYVKLLRTIATPDQSENRYITNTFVSPHYKSISSCYENQIEISLVNSEAEPFVFQSGAVHVTLHFRRKQLYNENRNL